MSHCLSFASEELAGSIADRFRRVVACQPDHTAVITGDTHLSYAALEAAAARIGAAVALREPSDASPVAILLPEGPQILAALLGCLMAGHSFTILPPDFPQPRLQAIWLDAASTLLLTDSRHWQLACTVTSAPEQCLNIESLAADHSRRPPARTVAAEDVAALFYTSGTTGEPKGVIWSQGLVLHTARQNQALYALTPQDRIAVLTSFGFGAAMTMSFAALLNGATLLLGCQPLTDISSLLASLRFSAASVLGLPPVGLMRQIVAGLPDAAGPDDAPLPDLRLVLLGGQPLRRQDVDRFRRCLGDQVQLRYRLAGSETMLMCELAINDQTAFAGEDVPVGFPVPDKEILLWDEAHLPVASGAVGEIVVASRYLATGYWRQPAQTAARFLADPNDPGRRLCLTGDMGRFTAEGMLQHLGRTDNMVKIRGYRVQLETVEAAITALDIVQEAAVVVQDLASGEKRLVAYVTPAAQPAPTTTALRRALLERLPNYMTPSVFVLLEGRLPLTPTGKVNRQALPLPGATRPALDTPFVAPRNALEQQLADIWAELLELDEVGVEDDFFALGGDSITAMYMWIKVEQGIGRTPPQDFLRHPTIATIARALGGEADSQPAAPPSVSVKTASRGRQPAPRRLRRQLRHLAEGVERRMFAYPLNMPYQDGMTWLRRWAQQPLVQKVRYFREGRLFQDFAASCNSPQAHDHHAFAEAILNNFWGSQLRQMTLHRPTPERIAALQHSQWRFWRDLGNQLAASLADPSGPAPYDIVGETILQDALRQGRGVILAGPHLPALGTDRMMLASRGIYPYALTGEAFAAAGGELREQPTAAAAPHRRVQRTLTLLHARELLGQGGVVHVPIDAAAGVGPRIYTPVGQRLFPFNVGAIELALATGAPLLPMTTLLQPDNRLRLTIAAPLATGEPQLGHDARLWIAAQACGDFLAALWRDAPYARMWGDMARFLSVARAPAEVSPGQWIDFDKRRGARVLE